MKNGLTDRQTDRQMTKRKTVCLFVFLFFRMTERHAYTHRDKQINRDIDTLNIGTDKER